MLWAHFESCQSIIKNISVLPEGHTGNLLKPNTLLQGPPTCSEAPAADLKQFSHHDSKPVQVWHCCRLSMHACHVAHHSPVALQCSVAALFIMFREALEASIIISIMLQLCTRLKLNKLKKWGE